MGKVYTVEVPGREPHRFRWMGFFDRLDLGDGLEEERGAMRDTPYFYASAGAMVGKTWAGDCPIDVKQNGSMLAYGRAVIEALEGVGYSFEQIVALCTGVTQAAADQIKDRADFSEAQPAAVTSSV